MSERAQRILNLITEADLSYGQLAKATGIPKSALQRYATGETDKIPIDRLVLIAKALRVSPAYLMGWDNTQIYQRQDAPTDTVFVASPAASYQTSPDTFLQRMSQLSPRLTAEQKQVLISLAEQLSAPKQEK